VQKFWTLSCWLRAFQISDAKILDNNVPVFLVTFVTQEVLIFRNAKTREISVGADNKVEQCVYIAAITRVEEELDNELTGGWKVIEVHSRTSSGVRELIFCRWVVVAGGHTSRASGIYPFAFRSCCLIKSSHTTPHNLFNLLDRIFYIAFKWFPFPVALSHR